MSRVSRAYTRDLPVRLVRAGIGVKLGGRANNPEKKSYGSISVGLLSLTSFLLTFFLLLSILPFRPVLFFAQSRWIPDPIALRASPAVLIAWLAWSTLKSATSLGTLFSVDWVCWKLMLIHL